MTYDPSSRTTRELLADWAAIMRQLRARDIIRTSNNPIGNIAEAVVALHYGGQRGSFSQGAGTCCCPMASGSRSRPLRSHPDVAVVEVSDAALDG